jgi:predicted Fe-Mo cluster-binding NifX family protein/putative methionine-R-sulfoxide reductase with GAF domain
MARILLDCCFMRIAISHQQGRVSPVFDVAARILLVDIENGRALRRNERALVQMDSLTRARQVSQYGVQVLICGAISWPLENALSSMGVRVIACICGPVEEIIQAYVNNKLAEPPFIMPGCLARQQRMISKKEGAVEKPIINYDTLVRITKAISTIQDPEEIVLITVEGVTHALNVKGCALFLFSEKSDELRLAGYYGLSDEYVDKGPVSAIRSIASSLQDRQPVAIFDVTDDPRIQYPDAAIKEGIASILSSPIIIGDRIVGCLRVYTAEPWEFTLTDVNFIQAVAQLVGMGMEMCRVNQGLRESIDVLEMMQDPKTLKDKRRTPFEGVPKSFTTEEMTQAAI